VSEFAYNAKAPVFFFAGLIAKMETNAWEKAFRQQLIRGSAVRYMETGLGLEKGSNSRHWALHRVNTEPFGSVCGRVFRAL